MSDQGAGNIPVTGDEHVLLQNDEGAWIGEATTQQIAALGGNMKVLAFPFAFDTPDLLTGAALYTPTIGDILYNAWIEIDEVWDGTTPYLDVGTFAVQNYGWFGNNIGPIPLTFADESSQTDGLLVGNSQGAATASDMRTNNAMVSVHDGMYSDGGGQSLGQIKFRNPVGGCRWMPGKFVNTNPVKVVVSQDGTNGGADPGSTQGQAILYLMVATPG